MRFRTNPESRWHSITRYSPDTIVLLDRELRIEYINHVSPGWSDGDVLGRHALEFVDPSYHPMLRRCYAQVLKTGVPAGYEVPYDTPDGKRLWFNIRVGPLVESEEITGLTLCVREVTEMRETEEALDRQTNILSAIIDSMADGVAVVDEQGEFLVYNRAAERLVGINPRDVRFEDWSEHFGLYRADRKTLFRVEDLPLAKAAAGERQEGVEVYVKNPRHPAGVVLSVNATPLVDQQKRHQGGVAVFRDVTAEKEAAEKLQSEEQLLRRLLDLQESERKLISHEIHDGFVQQVVGANMRLEAARAAVPAELPVLGQRLEQVSELLKQAIAEARRLISDLRPLVIDDEGIDEAIRHLVADMERQYDLEIDFEAADTPEIDPRMKGALYRIVQEALNNVRRHAKTKAVSVTMHSDERSVRIRIADSGVGFDLGKVPPERFGLRSIRERARLFGGKARVASAPGEGTVVSVELPLAPPRDS